MMISSVCLSKRFGSAKAFMICVEGVHPSGVQDVGGGEICECAKAFNSQLSFECTLLHPSKILDTKSKAQKNVL